MAPSLSPGLSVHHRCSLRPVVPATLVSIVNQTCAVTVRCYLAASAHSVPLASAHLGDLPGLKIATMHGVFLARTRFSTPPSLEATLSLSRLLLSVARSCPPTGMVLVPSALLLVWLFHPQSRGSHCCASLSMLATGFLLPTHFYGAFQLWVTSSSLPPPRTTRCPPHPQSHPIHLVSACWRPTTPCHYLALPSWFAGLCACPHCTLWPFRPPCFPAVRAHLLSLLIGGVPRFLRRDFDSPWPVHHSSMRGLTAWGGYPWPIVFRAYRHRDAFQSIHSEGLN